MHTKKTLVKTRLVFDYVVVIMKNEINLRTNKSEYNSGEEIYGVVYLRICCPTRGRGIRVCFKGYEQFQYKEKTASGNVKSYPGRKDYMNFSEVLYQSDEPLSLCDTLFPFKIPLLTEIPGTFKAGGETDKFEWSAQVEYQLEIQVIDEESTLVVTQAIQILQPLPPWCRYDGPPQACHEAYPVRFLLVFKRNVHVTGRLHDHIHKTGKNVILKLIITNNSSTQIQRVEIKLQRSITLITRRNEESDKCSFSVESNVPVGQVQQIDMTRFQKGLDNIQIPLLDVDRRPVLPSVRGQHILCEYKVLVTVYLASGDTFDLTIPVSVITAESPKQWNDWVPPAWVTVSGPTVQLSTGSIFRVPENMLRTAAFSNIPGFQPLG